MKAIAFRGVSDVRVEPTDALVRITTSAPRGYKIFDQKVDRAIKVLLKP